MSSFSHTRGLERVFGQLVDEVHPQDSYHAMTRTLLALVALLALLGCAAPTIGDPADVLETIGRIERLDPAMDALVPEGSKLEVVADGFEWTEGPLWIPEDGGYVIFSDIPPTKELSRPNGIAFSPDFKTLYVANSDLERAIWMAFPVEKDGTLGKGRVFFDAAHLVGKRMGAPDGLKVDRQGNLFATGPGGVLVLAPDGRHLGTLMTGQATSNCGFGDDGSTLYITADRYLVRIRLSTTGSGF